MIDEARREGKTVHFATLMDSCHLINAELDKTFPKMQRTCCTTWGWDVVKHDSSSHAVFTEQGFSASHRVEDAPKLLGLSASAKKPPPKIMGQYSRSRGTPKEICSDTSRVGLGTTTGWGKVPNCYCLFIHREKGTFLSVYVDDIKKWEERRTI